MADFRNHPRGQHGPPPKKESTAEAYLKANIAQILDFEDAKDLQGLLDNIQAYVREKGESITTSQLRNIFSKVKPIKEAQKLQLIRPQLAYVAARQNMADAKDVVNLLESIIKEVKVEKQVKNFVTFFEAIVAYHKLYHGKKSA